MGLRDLKLPTTTVKTPEGDLTVRGLAFNDFVILSQEFGPQMSLLFARYMDGREMEGEEAKNAFVALLPEVGGLVAAGIALACDDYAPETIEIAKKLRLSVQTELLETIFKLTIVSEGELKKLVESILRMASGATRALTTMRLPLSADGSGASEER